MVDAKHQKRQREHEHGAERAQEVPHRLRQLAPATASDGVLSGDGLAGHGLKIGVAGCYCESQPRSFGPKMFGRIASLAMFTAAILGIFADFPIISDWAFWFLVGAYRIWLGVHSNKSRFNLALSIALTLAAIVGVFVEIPTVSKYAFWVMPTAYLLVFGITKS